MITVGSLFDGIGGTPLCAQMSGAVCLWESEIESIPISITKHHFPGMRHLGDITAIKGDQIPAVDIIVGGSPCQDLSVAGKRAGIFHEDLGDDKTTRSGLFIDQARIVKEMRKNARATNQPVRPRFVVWENVPGAFSSNGGEDFRVVLEEFCRIADEPVSIPRPPRGKWSNAGCIMGDGFSLAWRVFDAQYWGTPQRRRRIYLVADFGGNAAPEILFERKGVSGNTAESGGAREGIAADASRGTRDSSGDVIGFNAKQDGGDYHIEQTPTMRAMNNKDANANGGSYLAVCYGLCSYASNSMKSDNPNSGCYEADTSRTLDLNGGNSACNQGGIAIVQPVVYDGLQITSKVNRQNRKPGDPCPTLHQGCSQNMVIFENHGQDSRITGPLDVSPTVSRKYGTGGNNVPLVAHGMAGNNVAATLDCAYATKQGLDNQHVNAGCPNFIYQPEVARIQKRVRRLTPLECERLQGYPDGWTEFGAMEYAENIKRKHPKDFQKGLERTGLGESKLLTKISDSARYRGLGNSFDIKNAHFVISRCVAVLEGSNT